MSAASPCRLFVYLAREAPVAAVLRRGPSAWARLSLWHTDTDEVAHGQWLKGRVYERRCDLSPDGSLFVAFVRKTEGRTLPNRDTWVAVSRPPWFTALAHWVVGGTWCTGGFFPDRRSLWLPFAPRSPDGGRLPPWLAAGTDPGGWVDRTPNWTERTVWFNRLLRGGWRPVEGAALDTWERPAPAGDAVLEMALRSESAFAAYGGPHVVEYAVRLQPGGETAPIGRADWADWDRGGRLVVARGGRLWGWEGPGALRELADFNPGRPDSAPPLAWALAWPDAPA